jgi:hypothetical protein
MDDVEQRRLAEQVADRLRALIKQFESLEGPAPEWVSVKLAWQGGKANELAVFLIPAAASDK